MKKLSYSLLILIGILAFTSCSNDDDSTSNSTLIAQIEANLSSGTWRITKSIDSGNDETDHYSGFNFTFLSSGIITATNGTDINSGNWSISDSNSLDDNPSDLEFNIMFGASSEFQELNDDWDISSQTSTKIELIDVSGGNGGTDYLTFEKN